MKFIDMHCDTIARIGDFRKQGKNYSLNSNSLQLDIVRMKEAGYLMQTFALFIDKGNTKHLLEDSMYLLDIFYTEMEKNSEWIRPVTSAKQLLIRSEEHTSELQSRFDLVCRLLLEKKKYKRYTITH